MRKVPERPAPIGPAPKAGVPNSAFPFVGPTDFAGIYQSHISAKEPLGQSVRNTIAAVKTPRLSDLSLSRSSGDRSRAEFAKATAGTSRNAMLRSADEFNTKYRSQAEQARAQDILGQRQNKQDRFRMDSAKAVFDEDTNVRFTEGIEDIFARGQRARSGAQAQITASFLRMLGGLI
jgi:hypothetical protein